MASKVMHAPKKNHQGIVSMVMDGAVLWESVLQLLYFPAHVPVQITLLGCCTLVMQLLATAQGDLYLDQVATQVDGGRDQRKAFLDYLAPESLDLTLVGEQSPVSIGVMVMDVPMCIRLYGKAYQSQRSVGDRPQLSAN